MTAFSLHQPDSAGRGRHLAVVTDSPSHQPRLLLAGSALTTDGSGFRHVVVCREDSLSRLAEHEASDTIALHLTAFDNKRIADLARRVRPFLRPGGDLLVLLVPEIDSPTDAMADPLTWIDFSWNGIESFGGRTCARLTVTPGQQSSPDVGHLLAAAHGAARLAFLEGASVTEQQAGDAMSFALARQLDARHRSERALLGHMNAIIQRIEDIHRRYRGALLLRTLAGRSPLGKALRPALQSLRRRSQ